MGIICRLEYFQQNDIRPVSTLVPSLRELLGPVVTWKSEEEKARVLIAQSERDMTTWRG